MILTGAVDAERHDQPVVGDHHAVHSITSRHEAPMFVLRAASGQSTLPCQREIVIAD